MDKCVIIKTWKGIILYFNGRLFEGQWGNDYKHGEGYEKFHTDAIYEGTFVNGKPQGIGRYAWPNGQVYEG